MGFDFSALDAELDGLGGAPPDAPQLADRIAGRFEALDDVDEELHQLELAARTLGAKPRPRAEPLAVPRRAEEPAPVRAPVALAPQPAPIEAPVEEFAAAVPASEPPAMPMLAAVESAPAQEEPAPEAAPFVDTAAWADELDDEGPSFDQAQPEAAVEDAVAEDVQHEAAADVAVESEWPASDDVHSQVFAAPVQREATPLTQSQEIVLPDPIPREELSHESGELRLDGDAPSSGSFSLPEPSPEPPRDALSGLVDDEVQDALEGSQPIALHAQSRPAAPPLDMDRDPDAEFDALLSEATDPRGIPTSNAEFDTDELLRGLEVEEPDAKPTFADALQLDGLDEPEVEGDSTEVIDRKDALSLQGMQEEITIRDDSTIGEAELDADELEILMDDEDELLAPPVSVSKVPPPPPPSPSAAPDKRPSLLGRLFNGKREE